MVRHVGTVLNTRGRFRVTQPQLMADMIFGTTPDDFTDVRRDRAVRSSEPTADVALRTLWRYGLTSDDRQSTRASVPSAATETRTR